MSFPQPGIFKRTKIHFFSQPSKSVVFFCPFESKVFNIMYLCCVFMNETASDKSFRPRYELLDGLRGVAALMVIMAQ